VNGGRRRIPFAVIGGFLGAGKTTLLNRLLRDNGNRAEPRRIAVLVNDFGQVNIDAALIEGASSDTIALTNGCVCCQIGDELTTALVGVLEAAPPFDAIVVEASGISDPWRIAQIARADPTLEPEAIVVLVDASAARQQSADPLLEDSLARQLARADIVALNKIDLVAPDELARVRDWVREHARDVAVFEVVDANLPVPLFGADWRVSANGAEADSVAFDETSWKSHRIGSGERPPADRFEACTFVVADELAADALRAFLKAMPAGVLRLKGVVPTDAHGWSELQYAGRHGSLRAALAPPKDGRGTVVAIGLRGCLPVDVLAAVFGPPARP
jgi:G3E family GTPase